jgi:hypothetical protein
MTSASDSKDKRIVGNADRLAVSPGDDIRFKVSRALSL